MHWGAHCFGLLFQFQFTTKQQNAKYFKTMLWDGIWIVHTIEISINFAIVFGIFLKCT